MVHLQVLPLPFLPEFHCHVYSDSRTTISAFRYTAIAVALQRLLKGQLLPGHEDMQQILAAIHVVAEPMMVMIVAYFAVQVLPHCPEFGRQELVHMDSRRTLYLYIYLFSRKFVPGEEFYYDRLHVLQSRSVVCRTAGNSLSDNNSVPMS